MNAVDSYVNKNRPLAINRMMATSEKFCQANRDKLVSSQLVFYLLSSRENVKKRTKTIVFRYK